MIRRIFFLVLLLVFLTPGCRKNHDDEAALLWPLPRMATLKEIKKTHRALEKRSRNDATSACAFARFALWEWLLAAQDLPSGHREELFANFGMSCPNSWRNPDCAVRFLEHLAGLFDRCAPADADLTAWGRRFLRWQGTLKTAWNQAYFEEALALLESPLARETRIALFAAFAHAVGLLAGRPDLECTENFVRWLGFPCAAWAASMTPAGPADNPADWPRACLLSCPQARISEPLADFDLRARKLENACPPETIGVGSEEDFRLYSLDNHLVFRTALFWRGLLADMSRDLHPVALLLAPYTDKARRDFQALSLTLFPAARFGETSPLGLPDISRAAMEPVSWPVVHIHAFGAMRVDEPSVYRPATGVVAHGRRVESVAPSFGQAIREAARFAEPTLSFSGPVSSEQLLEAAAVFREAGHARLRLLFRNSSQVLRACSLELSGPPPERRDIVLTYGPDLLSMTAAEGPLAQNPFQAAGPHDFSGLRQKLEQIRPKTPKNAVVHLRLQGSTALASIAKLLGYVMRNASGRPLFRTVILSGDEK